MNFKELCTKRFSVRSYLPTQVPDSAVEYILECARLAPSAVNKQPWVVYVCRDEGYAGNYRKPTTAAGFSRLPCIWSFVTRPMLRGYVLATRKTTETLTSPF